MITSFSIGLNLLSLALLILGPWPLLELIRGYLPFWVGFKALLVIPISHCYRGVTKSFFARSIFCCHIILTALLLGTVVSAASTSRPALNPDLLTIVGRPESKQNLETLISKGLGEKKAKVLVVRGSLEKKGEVARSLAGYSSAISLPELDLQIFFRGHLEILKAELTSLVDGLGSNQSYERQPGEASSVLPSRGGLIKFNLSNEETESDKITSNGREPLTGYLAFMRLPDGDTLENLREIKAYLRRLGAVVRHLEGPVFVLLDARLGLFQKQISYLEKVGRVELAGGPGAEAVSFLPKRNLVLFIEMRKGLYR